MVKVKVTGVKILACMEKHMHSKYKRCISIGMGVMVNELVGANANADADDWVTTLALLDFVRRAKHRTFS